MAHQVMLSVVHLLSRRYHWHSFFSGLSASFRTQYSETTVRKYISHHSLTPFQLLETTEKFHELKKKFYVHSAI